LVFFELAGFTVGEEAFLLAGRGSFFSPSGVSDTSITLLTGIFFGVLLVDSWSDSVSKSITSGLDEPTCLVGLDVDDLTDFLFLPKKSEILTIFFSLVYYEVT
jgi:hypothetical protein